MNSERPLNGVINFKSQHEINNERQQKLLEEYKVLKEETTKILKEMKSLSSSSCSNEEHLATLTKEDIQRIIELKQEINQIYFNARKRSI
jgi:site-specific DNA-adenine methylase